MSFEHLTRNVVGAIQEALLDPVGFHQLLGEQLGDQVRKRGVNLDNKDVLAAARQLADMGFLHESGDELFSLGSEELRQARAGTWFEALAVRLNVAASRKADALLAARRVRTALEIRGIRVLRGEYVRGDGRLYMDVSASTTLPGDHELVQLAGAGASITPEIVRVDTRVDECLNCGNVPDAPVAVCPNCNFREISPCPACSTDVPRAGYRPAGGSVFQCPSCDARVRLAYNEPLWREDGRYNEPSLVVTVEARRTA